MNSYGGDVCDCYAMSDPQSLSTRNGGTSRPLPFRDAEANARLIAAAPDLLAALRAMVCRCEPDTDGADRRMWEDARAAIAKAEGRT